MSQSYPQPERHLPPKEVFPNVWYCSSEIEMGVPLGQKIRFSRNMVAVLEPDGWVLLNPVRLSAETESEMLEKGPFRHAVRLGCFHGRDDTWYTEQHGAAFWAIPGDCSYEKPPIDHEISEEPGGVPIDGARAVIFSQAVKPECVVFLPRHNLLVTCDSVQHYENDPLISRLGKFLMKRIGFFTPCVIGPIWLRDCTPEGGSLKPDFERILELDFDNLIGGHGTPKIGGAKAALAANVAKLK